MADSSVDRQYRHDSSEVDSAYGGESCFSNAYMSANGSVVDSLRALDPSALLTPTMTPRSTPAPSLDASSFLDDGAHTGNGDGKPAKKRKSWGQELPEPKTNLPPRKRAKTEDEKEQRRIERVKRNRLAAHNSRERKRQEVELLQIERDHIANQLATVESEKAAAEELVRRMAAQLETWRQFVPESVRANELKPDLKCLNPSSTSLDVSFSSGPTSTMDPRQASLASSDSTSEPRLCMSPSLDSESQPTTPIDPGHMSELMPFSANTTPFLSMTSLNDATFTSFDMSLQSPRLPTLSTALSNPTSPCFNFAQPYTFPLSPVNTYSPASWSSASCKDESLMASLMSPSLLSPSLLSSSLLLSPSPHGPASLAAKVESPSTLTGDAQNSDGDGMESKTPNTVNAFDTFKTSDTSTSKPSDAFNTATPKTRGVHVASSKLNIEANHKAIAPVDSAQTSPALPHADQTQHSAAMLCDPQCRSAVARAAKTLSPGRVLTLATSLTSAISTMPSTSTLLTSLTSPSPLAVPLALLALTLTFLQAACALTLRSTLSSISTWPRRAALSPSSPTRSSIWARSQAFLAPTAATPSLCPPFPTCTPTCAQLLQFATSLASQRGRGGASWAATDGLDSAKWRDLLSYLDLVTWSELEEVLSALPKAHGHDCIVGRICLSMASDAEKSTNETALPRRLSTGSTLTRSAKKAMTRDGSADDRWLRSREHGGQTLRERRLLRKSVLNRQPRRCSSGGWVKAEDESSVTAWIQCG